MAYYKIFFINKEGKGQSNGKRERQNELKIYLSDDEQYILEQKWKASNMKSKSAFIRHLILYGYVYDVNYEHLREYNTILSRIGNNLNQIAKRMNATGNVYEADVKRSKGADETGMAITKIHAIKATVHKAVDYICNPAKTDESILISSFGCSPETAAFDFKFAPVKNQSGRPKQSLSSDTSIYARRSIL